MHRWIHLFGALALVLLLWTGGTAYAAERQMPDSVAAESTGHFAGDRDEVPSDEHQGAPHHHFTCGEHSAAAWSSEPAVAGGLPASAQTSSMARSILAGREPDADLRPPIA